MDNLNRYYKKNVDVHINWLLFLNSFRSISKKGFLDVAPKLETIRNVLYEKEIDEMIDAKELNQSIIDNIKILLCDLGLDDVVDCVASDIDEDTFIKYTQATYLRQSILGASEDFENNEYYYLILRNLKLQDNLELDGYSKNLLTFFLESIRVDMSEKVSINEYNVMVLTLLQTLYRTIDNSENYEVVSELLSDVLANGYASDIEKMGKIMPNKAKTLKKV